MPRRRSNPTRPETLEDVQTQIAMLKAQTDAYKAAIKRAEQKAARLSACLTLAEQLRWLA